MKNLSFLQGRSDLVLVLCMSLSLFSCSNEDEFTPSNEKAAPTVEVLKLSDWLPSTRNSLETFVDMPVLRFKNEQAYNETITQLNEMDKEGRDAYFKKLGFNGAYTICNNADEELEQIFEIEDSIRFVKEISKYKEKYNNIFAFNTIDAYDVTPYYTFTDEKLSLVGNIKGYVVIGNTLKTPENNTPTFDVDNEATATVAAAAPGPIEPGFKSFKNASLSIKNGKYKSTMTIGRIVNGNSFAVEFVTKKKQFLWKKSVSASYTADLEMQSSKFHHKNVVFCPNGCNVSILNLRIETVGNGFNARVNNFKCSRGKTVGSQSFNNIQVI